MTDPINDQLVNAISNKTLRPALAALQAESETQDPEQRQRVAAAASAIDTLDRAISAEVSRISDLLRSNNITVESILASTPDGAIHAIDLEVPRTSLELAAAQLEGAGYRSELRDDPPLWKRYAQFYDHATFMAADDREFRIQLKWGTPGGLVAKVPARLRPTVDDLGALPLPTALTSLYAIVKPVRQMLGQRQPSATDLGPFLGTPDGLIPHLLKFSGLERGQQLVDLGCGDGRILIEAAERFGCEAIGYETDQSLVDAARRAVRESTDAVSENVTLHTIDAREADVSGADVVFLFLPIPALKTLVPDLLSRMKPGAVLLAHEQEHLQTSVDPEARQAIVEPEGVTVAHKWRA